MQNPTWTIKGYFKMDMIPIELAKKDYEADLVKRPVYEDGSPRKKWEDLNKIEICSWRRKWGEE